MSNTKLTKNFPVFDCDAHINDPLDIWDKYVEPEYRELVKQSYWNTPGRAILNGRELVTGGHDVPRDAITINGITIGGPGADKRVQRRLMRMRLTPEQCHYLDHRGAYDANERVKELDIMGIDQVLVIPTMMVNYFPFIENVDGAYALARAYNNWVRDWCNTAPDRLYPAALIPIQNPDYSIEELRRVAKLNFPVALVRPIDANGHYPNRIFWPSDKMANNGYAPLDPFFRTIEETGIVLGMHTFPAPIGIEREFPWSPGELIEKAGAATGKLVVSSTFSFIFEAMTWTAQVLLSGFLDRYPKLKMAVFESNASWLPELLDHCDLLFKLFANERKHPAKRLPSEAFAQQCMVSFESDEKPVYRDWERFEQVGIWASDVYHHDASDAWTALRFMQDAEVPNSVQEKLMGGNARRFYGIEGKTFVSREAPIERPNWFPRRNEEFDKWWEKEAFPNKYPGGTPGASK
jgi:predicted TIM-barrel fold metal-dependent hydrolase